MEEKRRKGNEYQREYHRRRKEAASANVDSAVTRMLTPGHSKDNEGALRCTHSIIFGIPQSALTGINTSGQSHCFEGPMHGTQPSQVGTRQTTRTGLPTPLLSNARKEQPQHQFTSILGLRTPFRDVTNTMFSGGNKMNNKDSQNKGEKRLYMVDYCK